MMINRSDRRRADEDDGFARVRLSGWQKATAARRWEFDAGVLLAVLVLLRVFAG